MVAALIALTLAAEPVLAVGNVEVVGGSAELGLALQSIVEHDLLQVTDAVRTQADVDRAKAGGPQVRGATHLLLGKLMTMGKAGRFDVKVVDVGDRGVRGSASMQLTGDAWAADRSKLVAQLCKAAGVTPSGNPKTARYSADEVAAWGKALAAGTPEALTAFAEKWPDFGPAKRRLKK